MKVNVISNIRNGRGLQRDYEILKEDLEALGHQVRGVPFEEVTGDATKVPVGGVEPADVNLFLEIIVPSLLWAGKENWFIPNCEYYHPAMWDQYLDRIDRVLTKTYEAQVRWKDKISSKANFVGFRSRDMLLSVPKAPIFFHAPGHNRMKGTDVLIETWNIFGIKHPLTLVTPHIDLQAAAGGNKAITVQGWCDDAKLKFLMNTHRFHVYPSRVDGWGHCQHESLGSGAVLLSSIPMDGVDDKMCLPCRWDGLYNGVKLRNVTPQELFWAVERAASTDPSLLQAISGDARLSFEEETNNFRAALKEHFPCA